ncbi:transcriptional accessory protein [Firmicutes bacterium CAG:449]|nr:transcriptional accessory protein [Firmicutes bacterium CAG:449]
MEINQILAEEFNLKNEQINNVTTLLDEGNTIPFIARYRKEVTGSLDDEILRKLFDRRNYLLSLQERMNTVINTIDELGKLTPELKKQIENCATLTELEDAYRPYKPKKKTRAVIAKEKGLENLANYILKQEYTQDLDEYAKEFINEEKGVLSVEDAYNGAKDIIAEIVSDEAKYRSEIRKKDYRNGLITSKELKKEEKGVYDMYASYQESLSKVASHRILAMNRGEKQKYLKVKLETPDEENLSYLYKQIIKKNSPFESVLKDAIDDSYSRLIAPSIENEIRNDLTEKAEETSMNVFKENLHQVLLASPMKNKVVLGFDPGYAHGCKIAIVDQTGKVLSTTVIYPTEPRKEIEKSKFILEKLITKYHVDLIALGNGTASRESERFLKDLLSINDLKCQYAIVSESGASIYSASPLAKKEFPDFDVNLRSAVSIARRLQDPLAELVKITPESIGVGQYQHDMNQKRLKEVLSGVVEDCVNTVGVDLNLASPSLLEYVSGITPTLANNIVSYREENGRFNSRKDLLKVNKLGPKAFEQCAGFLRIQDGYPLDNTSVHPESYQTTIELLKLLDIDINKLNTDECKKKLDSISNVSMYAQKLNIGEPTLLDIIEELKKPGRDIREKVEESVLNSDVIDISDLKEGMILKGTVRNIMDFGCFVDIGVHVDGLVHISELSNKFIKHPLDVVKINQIVTVKVISVDQVKKRIGLSIKQV